MQYIAEIAGIEVAMTIFIIWVLHYVISRREVFNLRTLAISSFLLTMMAGMFNAMAYYLLYPGGFIGTVIAVNIAMFEMTVLIVILLFIEDKGRGMSNLAGISLSVLFIFNEVSMGIFLYILGNLSALGNSLSVVDALGFAMNNYLLIIPMVTEMLFLVFYLKPGAFYMTVFIFLILMSATDPLVTGTLSSTGYGIILNFVMMASAMIVITMKLIGENTTLRRMDISVVSILFALFALLSGGMLTGAYLGAGNASYWLPYGVISAFIMISFYVIATLRLDKSESPATKVSTRTVIILVGLIFVSSVLSVLSIVVYFVPGSV